MEEVEAEALLLALGAALEWERYERDDYVEEEARAATGRYLVKKNVRHHFFRDEVQCRVYFCTSGEFELVPALPLYQTLPEARMVCERHHATGKWQ